MFGLVLLAGTVLRHTSARVAAFDANNVTKMEFTFQGVPGRDGKDGQPGPVGPQGIVRRHPPHHCLPFSLHTVLSGTNGLQ